MARHMTVAELKARLATLDDALLVVLSRDAEGNGLSPLATVETGDYTATSTWRGFFLSATGDRGAPVNAVCLVPVN